VEVSGLDVVRRYRDLIGEKRVEEAVELFSPDFEFASPQGTHGLAEVKEMWSAPGPQFDHLELEIVPVCLYAVDETRFVTESDYVFRWKQTGEIGNVDHRAMLYTVENGKIRRMRFFLEHEEAWAEAGVERP
jgi:ketosteroid isomerase-like protein